MENKDHSEEKSKAEIRQGGCSNELPFSSLNLEFYDIIDCLSDSKTYFSDEEEDMFEMCLLSNRFCRRRSAVCELDPRCSI